MRFEFSIYGGVVIEWRGDRFDLHNDFDFQGVVRSGTDVRASWRSSDGRVPAQHVDFVFVGVSHFEMSGSPAEMGELEVIGFTHLHEPFPPDGILLFDDEREDGMALVAFFDHGAMKILSERVEVSCR